MNRILFGISLILKLISFNSFCQELTPDAERIIIEIQIPKGSGSVSQNLPNFSYSDEFELQSVPFDYIEMFPEWKTDKQKLIGNHLKFILFTNKPLIIKSSVLGNYPKIVTPGDSLYINYDVNNSAFSGIGAEGFAVQNQIEKLMRKEGPTKNPLILNSQTDYFEWIKYCDSQLSVLLPLINSLKNKLPQQVYNYIKSTYISMIENHRCVAFYGLFRFTTGKEQTKLTLQDLNKVWDSTQNNTVNGEWLRSLEDVQGSISYYFNFNRMHVRRKFNFDSSIDTLNSKILRVKAYYDQARKSYKGLIRERLLQQLVSEEIITELGPTNDFTQTILKDFYSLPGYPSYRRWMENYFNQALQLRPGQRAPEFVLTDKYGKEFSKKDLKGKVALLDFWFSGCSGCVQMTPALKKVEETFRNDTNVVFVSVSIDKERERWEKSIKQSKYTTGTAINLYTGGAGADHSMIKRYNISAYPELFLFNLDGEIVENPLPDPRTEMGMEKLLTLIREGSMKISSKNHALANDGPYVLYQGQTPSSFTLTNNALNKQNGNIITVQTDIPDKTFSVSLKAVYQPEASIYTKPEKLFALSDIEGNFEAFRKLLQANKIMDENFNWTFGNGHLVFGGDMFDRGLQVTECLWLIYSLEEKAKKAGGYVHFILGNHEIMNLQGNHKYTHQKYKDNAIKMGKSLTELYNEDSELGRWLRAKNIIEKIGDLLFVHGGISPEINRLGLAIAELNNLARPYYAESIDSSNQELLILFNDKRVNGLNRTSPFWFRGYYGDMDNMSEIPTMQQIDSMLTKFEIKHIITGHTIVADSISLWYNNKVINIDTRHAEGYSEALLIEEKKYYRVNAEGKRVLLPVQN